MTTYKTGVFERLFRARWDSQTASFLNLPTVTLENLMAEIEHRNAQASRSVSDRNPANFFKDFIRNFDLANKNWPAFVLASGFTARQLTGGGQAFEFVPLGIGQTQPFPKLPPPTDLKPTLIQSLNILPLARQLGRKEETWLMQVVAKLHIVETHFAVNSPEHQLDYVELLQLGVKQNRAEIDGLYIARNVNDDSCLISIEAKIRDDIYPTQVFAQVDALRSMRNIQDRGIRKIIPLAIKVVAKSTIYIAEFPSVPFSGSVPPDGPPVGHGLYKITPDINGI